MTISDKRRAWKYRLKKVYGITPEEYRKILVEQNYVCAICFESELHQRNLAVDHNHKTGKVRGLLCQRCNTLLGLGEDNLGILRNATEYLLKTR